MVTTLKLDSYKFRCNCGKLHMGETRMLDFDCVEEEEREMGSERAYEAMALYDCECGQTIEITFEVWEYPEGAYNCQDCSCSGGEVTVKPKVRVHIES